MAYLYNLPNASTGIDDILVQTVGSTNTNFPFINFILIFVWLFVFLTGFNSQRRREGFGDAPIWSLLASVTTFMVTLLLSSKAGLINIISFGVSLALLILSAIWFFFSKGRNEQV